MEHTGPTKSSSNFWLHQIPGRWKSHGLVHVRTCKVRLLGFRCGVAARVSRALRRSGWKDSTSFISAVCLDRPDRAQSLRRPPCKTVPLPQDAMGNRGNEGSTSPAAFRSRLSRAPIRSPQVGSWYKLGERHHVSMCQKRCAGGERDHCEPIRQAALQNAVPVLMSVDERLMICWHPRFLSSDTSVSLNELCKILECLQGLYDHRQRRLGRVFSSRMYKRLRRVL